MDMKSKLEQEKECKLKFSKESQFFREQVGKFFPKYKSNIFEVDDE